MSQNKKKTLSIIHTVEHNYISPSSVFDCMYITKGFFLLLNQHNGDDASQNYEPLLVV